MELCYSQYLSTHVKMLRIFMYIQNSSTCVSMWANACMPCHSFLGVCFGSVTCWAKNSASRLPSIAVLYVRFLFFFSFFHPSVFLPIFSLLLIWDDVFSSKKENSDSACDLQYTYYLNPNIKGTNSE